MDVDQLALVMGIAQAMCAIEGEVGWIVIVDCRPHRAQDAQGLGTFAATVAADEKQRQERSAADMHPMTLSTKAQSRLVAADRQRLAQQRGDARHEPVQIARHPLLTGENPTLAGTTPGQSLEQLAGASHRHEMPHGQVYRPSRHARAVLGGLSGKRGCLGGRDPLARGTDLALAAMLGDLQADLRQIEDLMLDHFNTWLASQVRSAGTGSDGMFNGVVWLGDGLETMTHMATLTTALLARSAASTPRLRSRIGTGRCMCLPTIAEWSLNLRGGLQFNPSAH